MRINFTKMQGLGNDFVVIDLITQPIKVNSLDIQFIANRHFGIGCDQILFIEPPIRGDTDFYLRIFNANGTEAEQCGNGLRCAARFFYEMGFTSRRTLRIECIAGIYIAFIERQNLVKVNMGVPKWQPADIPFTVETEALLYPIRVEESTVSVSVASMGNPHAVLQVSDIDAAPVEKLGSLISKHPDFPQGVNVGFMQVVDRARIRLRVYERGVGETMACGSGACAAVCAGIRLGILASLVSVSFSGIGKLTIHWSEPNAPLFMEGPAVLVFLGFFRT